jgi:hypothetical protein
MANLQLDYHNAAVNREKELNLLCTKCTAIVQYVVSALLSRALTIDKEAHSILIRNRITNLPDRNGISLYQALANLRDRYGTADETAKSKWETIFNIPKETNEPIINFLFRWATSQTRLNHANRSCTNHSLISKFIGATAHDRWANFFLAELNRRYLGNKRKSNFRTLLDIYNQIWMVTSTAYSKYFQRPLFYLSLILKPTAQLLRAAR